LPLSKTKNRTTAMYQPRHFEETRTDVLHQLVRQHPLATLVHLGPNGLDANHVPLQLHCEPGKPVVLRGHVARANALWREADLSVAVLAVFQGPQHYISPSWYASKAEAGKVVPTWNYAVVHAKGRLHIHDDAAWIRAQMQALTTQQEAPLPHPWAVDDAPAHYIERLLQAVVGLELVVDSLQGKWKVSQNQPVANQASVQQALQADGGVGAADMAALVQAYGGRDGPGV
jgi:transcriptional regulator